MFLLINIKINELRITHILIDWDYPDLFIDWGSKELKVLAHSLGEYLSGLLCSNNVAQEYRIRNCILYEMR